MLRTVSIIPGIENFAPDRTDTSSGSCGSPSSRPALSSNARSARVTCTLSSGGTTPSARYRRHASVVTVNPGGTGNPSRVISARLAPLPPKRSFSSLLPSLNSYTYFGISSTSRKPASGRKHQHCDPAGSGFQPALGGRCGTGIAVIAGLAEGAEGFSRRPAIATPWHLPFAQPVPGGRTGVQD